jgi:hypothetical protein
LGNLGWAILVGYSVVVGFVLAYLDWRTRILMARGQELYSLALVGMVVLFTVFSTAYNLRTATRMLYYALALDVVIRVWLATTSPRKRQQHAPSRDEASIRSHSDPRIEPSRIPWHLHPHSHGE